MRAAGYLKKPTEKQKRASAQRLKSQQLVKSRAYTLYLLPLNDEGRSGMRDLNPQPQPWQGYALPLSYFRQLRWLGGGRATFSINLWPLSAAIGASCKESWSRVELGCHFILVMGVSAPQDQTSYSLASQQRHLPFKLSYFLRRLLLFYDNPSSSSTSLFKTSRILSHSFSPLGWHLPATKANPCENGDGDVFRPSPVHQLEPHSSTVDVTDQPHSSGQQPCPACFADCQSIQLTSEDSNHPAQHTYSWRQLHYVSQGKITPEDQQFSPVSFLPTASSDSGSLSQGASLLPLVAGRVEAELEEAVILETVDRAEASKERELMEEASHAIGTQRLFSGSRVKGQAS
ncbi:hypothetical protein GOBAR_AA14324 [Gossypium barbadense]|uniref:Uncharacterized protein n=1 Tax=Gossypium barbadense TaxID=3634 RepID=A0A2P5XSI0_GOSBA|nr:hypothetical protein GOBAR_AA14324 [Gossypium barbadense]